MFRINASNAAFALAVGLSALPALAEARDVAPIETASVQTVILGVVLNGVTISNGELFLEDSNAHLLASAPFLQRWNLRHGHVAPRLFNDMAYFDLQDMVGLQTLRDGARSEVILVADRAAFEASTVDANALQSPAVQPYVPGGFFNYDIAFEQTPATGSLDALIGLGLFAGTALVTHTAVLRDGNSVRLMSSYQTDFPESMKTLKLGDSVNTTGAWGLGVLFGGLQYGTNFAVRPEFIAQSMPGVGGDAVLPSTVDVYVNNVLRSRQNVEAGPFSIQNLPLVSGQGEMQVVVRDLLGREQVITQPFMVSPGLLREGLVQESYAFGAVRRNYGLQSNDYGDPFASLTLRKGMSGQWTSEVRAEAQRKIGTVGITNTVQMPRWRSVLEASFAASTGAQDGGLFSLLYSYSGNKIEWSTRATVTSAGFRQLGTNLDNLPSRLATLQAVVPLGTGTFIANYLYRQSQTSEQVKVLNLSFSQRLTPRAFVTFSVLNTNVQPDVSVLASMTVYLDRTHSTSARVNHEQGADTAYVDFAQTADTGNGETLSYRLATTQGPGHTLQDAAVSSEHSFGSWGSEAVQQNGAMSERLWASGGAASLGNGIYFSRGIAQSFAIVQVGQTADVPVYLENQLVARTRKDGTALLGNLRAYQDNRVSVDALSVPLDSSVGATSQVVRPRLLGGVPIDFAVHPVIATTLTVQQSDGTPLPAWTDVRVQGTADSFVVGRRGEVYVEFPAAGRYRLTARPEGGDECGFEIRVRAGSALPTLARCQ
jgi:outer membrane usher protein